MATEITVRGSFSAFHPAERGTAYVALGYEGREMEPVYQRVVREFEQLKSSVATLQQDGAVTWWSAEQLRTWSSRPWNQDGNQLPLVHHANVGMEVKFRDFGSLARWVGQQIAGIEGFSLQRVKWSLTDERRGQLIVQARTRAVRDASTRAQQYADALGLDKVRPVAIADAGMLGSNLRPIGDEVVGSVRAAVAPQGSAVELVPNDIEISARVDAQFIADDRHASSITTGASVLDASEDATSDEAATGMQPPAAEARWQIHGPAADRPSVEAWADDYIRFEGRPPWQDSLRAEIRARCGELEPSADEVLHATFFGRKHPKADVENLVLYNIDSFRVAGRNGIRFEHGAAVPAAADNGQYPFCYRYALAPRSDGFAHWESGSTLASFDWVDLGTFAGEKKLAQVWLALARAKVQVMEQIREPETPFAVRVRVRPPHVQQPLVLGNLVKGIVDGVICAFQAHIDASVLPEVVARLAKSLPADGEEIRQHLLDQRRAVLGAVPRLVSPYQSGVKWDPADHMCVAGELLSAKPAGASWAIKGELVEVSR